MPPTQLCQDKHGDFELPTSDCFALAPLYPYPYKDPGDWVFFAPSIKDKDQEGSLLVILQARMSACRTD